MSEISSMTSCIGYLSDYNESLLKCCHCQCSMSDPVTLNCLHSCCKSCSVELNCRAADTEQQTLKFPSSTRCPVCYEQTECSAVTPNGLLSNYKRLAALAADVVYCSTCDAGDVAAVFWCADCCKGLCDSCLSLHRQFTTRHRSAALEVVRTWSVGQLTPAAQCDAHKQRIEHLCFTCREPRCRRCGESCRARKHDLIPLSHDKIVDHLPAAIANVRKNVERVKRTVSSLLQKCQDARSRLQEARQTKRTKVLVPHKRHLQVAIDSAFDASVNEVHENLGSTKVTCTMDIERRIRLCETVHLAARNIEVISVDHLHLRELFRKRHLLKETANRCLSTLDKSLNQHRKYGQEKGACIIAGSLPLTSDIVLRSCIGATDHKRATQHGSLLFGQASVTFDPKVVCWDLSVTRDSHVLLAAAAHGLLVYSDIGQHLSTWRPKSRYGRDGVSCVAALSDGRVAVGVVTARRVVLLRLSETGDSWQEDHCVAVLQLIPWRIAVHGDLLAAAEGRVDTKQQLWVAGRKVKLLRLSSCQFLYTQSRHYDIARVALTALCLVTTSYDPVKSENGASPYLVEAFSHSGEPMWSYKTSDEEATFGLCVLAETWGHVYVTVVRRSDWSNSRIIAIGGADGKVSRNVMTNRTLGLRVPWHLSLARDRQQRAVLVASSRGGAVQQYRQARVVSLYVATGK